MLTPKGTCERKAIYVDVNTEVSTVLKNEPPGCRKVKMVENLLQGDIYRCERKKDFEKKNRLKFNLSFFHIK